MDSFGDHQITYFDLDDPNLYFVSWHQILDFLDTPTPLSSMPTAPPCNIASQMVNDPATTSTHILTPGQVIDGGSSSSISKDHSSTSQSSWLTHSQQLLGTNNQLDQSPRANRGHERQTGYMVLYAYQVMEVMLHKQEKLSGS
jgi:hypothetical protein